MIGAQLSMNNNKLLVVKQQLFTSKITNIYYKIQTNIWEQTIKSGDMWEKSMLPFGKTFAQNLTEKTFLAKESLVGFLEINQPYLHPNSQAKKKKYLYNET